KTLEDTIKESQEFREAYESSDEARRLVDVAKTLEGVSRNVSTHAAGVVIAPEPLVRYTPLQYGPGREAVITQYDMKAVGDIGLFRPGPMVNIPAFIARKQGREPIEYMHERLEPILRDTYGVMIYQEQVMMAAREIAGFSLSEADILRAAMGKKDKAKMAKLR